MSRNVWLWMPAVYVYAGCCWLCYIYMSLIYGEYLANVHFSDIPHSFIPHFTLHSAEKNPHQIFRKLSVDNFPHSSIRIPQNTPSHISTNSQLAIYSTNPRKTGMASYLNKYVQKIGLTQDLLFQWCSVSHAVSVSLHEAAFPRIQRTHSSHSTPPCLFTFKQNIRFEDNELH